MGISMSESDQMRRLQSLHQHPNYLVTITNNSPIIQSKLIENQNLPHQLGIAQLSKLPSLPQEQIISRLARPQKVDYFYLQGIETLTEIPEIQQIKRPLERERSSKLASQNKQNYEQNDLVKWSRSQLMEPIDNRTISSALRARKVKIVKS